jgi:hypothetical protein
VYYEYSEVKVGSEGCTYMGSVRINKEDVNIDKLR